MMDAYSQLCRNECQKFATESARQYKQVIEAIELPEKDVKGLEDKCQNQLLSTLISFEQQCGSYEMRDSKNNLEGELLDIKLAYTSKNQSLLDEAKIQT